MRRSSGRSPRVVVDTNLFVSGAISPTGTPRVLIQHWLDNHFILVLSDDQAREIAEVFGRTWLRERYNLPTPDLEAFLLTIDALPRVAPNADVPLTVRDQKDTMILATAFGGAADYIVSGDQDLLVLADDARLGDLRIVSAADFLAILKEQIAPA